MRENPYQPVDLNPSAELSDLESPAERLHHIDAVHFVHHALKHAIRDTKLMRDGNVTSEGLCRILLELAVDEFGAAGQEILIDWNLETSADVGLIVNRMRYAEVEEANLVQSDADFSALFDLRQPPESWLLTW